jgi:hypothetical protein
MNIAKTQDKLTANPQPSFRLDGHIHLNSGLPTTRQPASSKELQPVNKIRTAIAGAAVASLCLLWFFFGPRRPAQQALHVGRRARLDYLQAWRVPIPRLRAA